MNSKALKLIQKRELEILEEIDRICKKNDISYVLIGGSCLGAVRHNDMIPWDDDIDLGMTRDDFEKFKKVCVTDLKKQYYYQDMFTENNCSLVFGKIRDKNSLILEGYSMNVDINKGIWVDIFPYDRIPDDIKLARKINSKINFFKSLLNVKCGYRYSVKGKEKIEYWIARIVSAFIPKRFLKNKIYKLMLMYNEDKNNSYNYITYGGFGLIEILPYDICSHTMNHKFGDREYPIPKEYEKYLTKLYGDYMKLPPKEQRENGHGVKKLVIDNEEIDIN